MNTTCTKIAYSSAGEAHEAARSIRAGKHRSKRGMQTRAYLCPHCHAYHLTSARETAK